MTLEKLLIFGFALAVLFAVATLASTTGDTRQTGKTGYIDEMTTLRNKAP